MSDVNVVDGVRSALGVCIFPEPCEALAQMDAECLLVFSQFPVMRANAAVAPPLLSSLYTFPLVQILSNPTAARAAVSSTTDRTDAAAPDFAIFVVSTGLIFLHVHLFVLVGATAARGHAVGSVSA